MSGHKSGVQARISKIAYSFEGNISCSSKYSYIGNSQTGDPIKYKTVAAIYMLLDFLHTVAKLQTSLQGTEVDLGCYGENYHRTVKRA